MARIPNPAFAALQAVKCACCGRMPVKSRRNTRCLSCSAAICLRCQGIHFEDEHAKEWP